MRRFATVTILAAALAWGCPPPPPPAPPAFVNFETPPVHPLDLTPDGGTLLAANLADGRLEVFDVSGVAPAHAASIPVGVDPVSVRARTNTEVWVVNHLSDSVSVVDLALGNVVATIPTGDEPADVVFAGAPQRAFVSISQENRIAVYDPASLAAPPLSIPVQGEDPRALATDGVNVYAAIFESGNGTTLLTPPMVSNPGGPYGGQNPPPLFSDPFNDPTAPAVSLIVRKAAGGQWLDDNGVDWSALVGWDLHDHDVAILPANNPGAVSYVSGLMNLDMALAVLHDGRVGVVGSEAINEVRFEPRVRSRFARNVLATFDPAGGAPAVADVNPHLDYVAERIDPAAREASVADLRAIAWSAAQDRGYVAGMGSNNVIVTNATGARLGRVDVGAGPAGLALKESANLLYVLNRFDATISTVNTQTLAVAGTTGFFDPTPQVIKNGRPLLYDAHRTSGLGQASCASCHADARMDQIAWDLGDPDGAVKPFNQNCRNGTGGCEDWRPLKGPMTTQTLQGAVGHEPLHWRGDREDLAAFTGAFASLMGLDEGEAPSAADMAAFEAFLATVTFPPNPFRNFDGSLRNAPLPGSGVPTAGEQIYLNADIDRGQLTCNECHALPSGTNGEIIGATALQESQSFKVPHLRNMHEKTGFRRNSLANNRGFGFAHDGVDDTLVTFLSRAVFVYPGDPAQMKRDLEAFVFSLATDTHASVGKQRTLTAANKTDPAVLAFVGDMIARAEAGQAGLVAKGRIGGLARGARYDPAADRFQTDRAAETLDLTAALALVGAGSEVTLTVVPLGTETRIGIDRDSDGKFDRDELDAGTDPADPLS